MAPYNPHTVGNQNPSNSTYLGGPARSPRMQ
uniref:Uncharacterized protein n=1 Tax=Arundo donax TaxID=35708 RepID=A0A0A9B3K9_ARUDO